MVPCTYNTWSNNAETYDSLSNLKAYCLMFVNMMIDSDMLYKHEICTHVLELFWTLSQCGDVVFSNKWKLLELTCMEHFLLE